MRSMVKSGLMKELKCRGASACSSWKRCRGELILLGKPFDLGLKFCM